MKQQFAMIPQDKTSYGYLFFFVLSAFCYYVFLEQAFMLGDDYYYGTFLQNGLSLFWEEVQFHYLSINGRIVVHCFAAVLLLFDTLLFPLFGLICWIYLVISLLRVQYHPFSLTQQEMISRFSFLFTFLTAYLLTIDISILKETLLWISAFFNYIFPICLLMTLFLLLRSKKNLLPILCCSLLLGATTEQMGLISFVCVSFLGVFLEKSEHKFYHWKLSSAFLFLGFATVLFSPGSIQRMEMESGGDIADWAQHFETIEELTGILVSGNGGAYHVLSFFCVVPLYLFFVDDKKVFALCYGIFALIQLYTFTMVSHYFIHFVGIVLGFASLCLYFIYKKRPYYVALIGGGCGTIVSIIPSSFTEPRVIFPFLLLFGLAYGLMALEGIEALASYIARGKRCQKDIKKNATFLCYFLGFILINCALFVTLPTTMTGLQKNLQIEKQNLEQIKNSTETKEIAYLMDYDLDYSHILFIHNGFHYNAFLKYYDIPSDVTFRTWSQEQPMVKINDQYLKFPSYEKDGSVYLPLDLLATALDGYYWWTPYQTEIGIREDLYILKNGQVFLDSRTEPGSDEVNWHLVCDASAILLSEFYLPLASIALIEELFSVTIFLHEENYVVMWA